MADTLPKGYEPHDVEARWRKHWEEKKTFTPDPDAPGEPYSIVIPPPNVTGALHIGHALNLTLIDVLCRHARQKGKNVLWVPGTDHAGIATQNVVERALAKEGKTRRDLGREAFVEKVWEWRADYGHRILNQIGALGCSVDWTRLRFTMDEGLSAAVRKVFVQLYDEGLIYKGHYIINWCSRCHTALADDEVEHEPEQGQALERALPPHGRFWLHRHRHHPPRNHSRRHGRLRASRGRTLCPSGGQNRARARAGTRGADHRGQLCGPRVRHRRVEGHTLP